MYSVRTRVFTSGHMLRPTPRPPPVGVQTCRRKSAAPRI